MNLKKRVIECTVTAVMLMIVTAVTAVIRPTESNVISERQEVAYDMEANGIAGIIEECYSLDSAATELASVERANVSMVAAAQEPEPELTEEELAWSNRLMADVDEFLYIRSTADSEAEIAGKLYKGAAGEVVESLDGWYHINSGSVDGYVKSEYCVVGQDAYAYALENCDTVATVTTNGLRIRGEASEDGAVYKAANEGDQLVVDTQAQPIDGWITVSYKGNTAYVSSEYVTVELQVGKAISTEEEQEMLRRQAEEEAAKRAAQTTVTTTVQRGAVAASADEVTLLAAIIQCEAGSECYEGQLAVGAVVMNRVRSGSYPGSIYEVIFQSGQFTPAGNGKVDAVINSGVNASCVQAAQEALAGMDNTGGATSFRRASSGYAGLVIGNHVFF
ncbi:MAG: cell wall hydrolase [Lachnospiraceae bacterium]|nr:cell wall hydrolase [Lachnospiraceae bacterium]